MQTFLPYADFVKTARALDQRRLGKQRAEALTVLRCLQDPSRRGWRNHPAIAMWRGYEDALKAYMNAMIDEWVRRGYQNNMPKMEHSPHPAMPPWLGDPEFHRSHQSNLIRKDSAYYRRLFPGVPDNLPYVWPVRESKVQEQS